MSEPRKVVGEDEQFLPQEEEHLPTRSIFLVGAGAVLLFALAVVASTWLLGRTELEQNPDDGNKVFAGAAKNLGQPEQGIVDQELFTRAQRAANRRAEELQRLSSYGWVSRQDGVVHLPIARAMELSLQGQRAVPAAAAAPAAATPDAGTEAPAGPDGGTR